MTLRVRTAGQFMLDPICMFAMTMAALISFYLAVTYPQVMAESLVFICMILAGFGMHIAFCGGLKMDTILSLVERMDILIFSSVGIIAVFFLQRVAFQISATVLLLPTFEAGLFYLVAAVAEETFFRFYLQTLIHQQLSRIGVIGILNAIIGVVSTSAVFAIFHSYVFAMVQGAMLAIFFSSLILGTVYYLSKRLSVPLLTHAFVNFAVMLAFA